MSMRLTGAMLALAALCPCLGRTADATLNDDPVVTAEPVRPAIEFNRWKEDWSVLADPALRTEPLDNLKYIALSDNDRYSYISLGAGFRERFESNDEPSFGVGHQPTENYVIERAEVHVDIHPDVHWQIFTQFQDDRAFGKQELAPVDADKFDIEQAFIAFSTSLFGGTFKARVGRQEIGFDLQRFVSERDGPNVRQAFDAAWFNWEAGLWRFISFWSHPVQDVNNRPFDDYSNPHFQYGGFRVERKDVGPGSLSTYLSRYELDGAKFLFAQGDERRNILDVRYTGTRERIDWDLEAMGQGGEIGTRQIRAWNIGTITGYKPGTFDWKPRLALQVDAASGNRSNTNGSFGTFNPLFPNGYYVTLSGYTGDTNLYHVKPSIAFAPLRNLTMMMASGFLWRETTADAIYLQPDIPVRGTAGTGSHWSASYAQLRTDCAFNANMTGAVEYNHYVVGETIRNAGGHDSNYLGVELKYQW